jgi:hypothetical protein
MPMSSSSATTMRMNSIMTGLHAALLARRRAVRREAERSGTKRGLVPAYLIWIKKR